MVFAASLTTSVGPVAVTESDGVISGVHWTAISGQTSPLLAEALRQLAAYFAGGLTRFDLPLDLGSGLQSGLRRAMLAIPYGQTRTYGDLARDLGAPAQAIGQACGANAVPIFIPCHRVIGAKGLGGYSGAGWVETKVALLRLEGAASLLI
jgi:methylated-DNA-[protein]-cysteine S-methyltransferase